MSEMDEGILLYALRYALGRRTYAPGDVQTAIWNAMPIQHKGTREAMIRDIQSAADKPDGLGDNLDRSGWLNLLDDLKLLS